MSTLDFMAFDASYGTRIIGNSVTVLAIQMVAQCSAQYGHSVPFIFGHIEMASSIAEHTRKSIRVQVGY